MFQKICHSEALKLFTYCHHTLRKMTFHHMSHLSQEMGTKCTVMHAEKSQSRTQREREFLMCNKSMTFADTNCDRVFSTWDGPQQGGGSAAGVSGPWRRPTPGGKENIFLAALCLFFSTCWINAPNKTNYCNNWTLTM